MSNIENTGFETRAIHAGQEPDEGTGAVVPPISLSTTFRQHAPGDLIGPYDYARAGNPTRTSVEVQIASLEGGRHGHAFASGQSAQDAILRLLPANAHMLIPHDAYGGTFRLINAIHTPGGLQFDPVHYNDAGAVEALWRNNTKMIWIESPSNPNLAVIDIQRIADYAHERGALVVVDNTFASPYLQLPFEFSADIVVHSGTKYLSGHSDVTAGIVVVNDDDLAERLAFFQKAIGAVLSPFDSYLLSRGVKTLAVRMERHCDNAEAVAAFLAQHPAVEHVLYPGLPTHEHHEIAAKQMKRFGGMVSFTMHAGQAASIDVVKRTKIFTLAESLGAVESLIEHPGLMTHASTAGSPLEVDDSLIRLSVGIESIGDLLDDLESALDAAGN
jgi:cystathionine gamma-synthase